MSAKLIFTKIFENNKHDDLMTCFSFNKALEADKKIAEKYGVIIGLLPWKYIPTDAKLGT